MFLKILLISGGYGREYDYEPEERYEDDYEPEYEHDEYEEKYSGEEYH